MFKKLLTLATLAAFAVSANAEVKVDWFKDYTVDTWNYYVMGYIPSQENGWLTVTQTRGSWERVDGEAVYTPNDDKDGDGMPDISWYQLFVGDNIPTEAGQGYTVTVYGKADVEATANMNMQWGWGDGQSLSANFTFGTEWDEISVDYPEVGGASCALVFQPGTQETTFEIKWIKVSHNDTSKPVEWVELLTGGDAESGPVDCAVAKIWEGSNDSTIAPCAVEDVDAAHGKAFVAHATQKYVETWDNQFWIVAPEHWNSGDIFLLSFDYKAATPAKASTQYHNDPGAYQHWGAIGDINFTTDWQTYSQQITIPSEANKGHSIAFNLNDFESANDYYFDNISLKGMKLDEGWFVAVDKNDVDNAVEMLWNEEEGIYEVCVGEDAPVGQVMISTKRGNRTAFNSNCIKVTLEIVNEEWMPFDHGYGTITLPEEGVWSIQIDPVEEQICFSQGNILSIKSVEADDNAAVVYYNLQGVQVQNPAKGGIYIKKQGNKVSKIIR